MASKHQTPQSGISGAESALMRFWNEVDDVRIARGDAAAEAIVRRALGLVAESTPPAFSDERSPKAMTESVAPFAFRIRPESFQGVEPGAARRTAAADVQARIKQLEQENAALRQQSAANSQKLAEVARGVEQLRPRTAAEQLDTLATQRAAEAGLPYAQAYAEVLSERPDLYAEYEEPMVAAEPAPAAPTLSPAEQEIERKVNELRKKDPSLSYEAAYTKVCEQNPDLYLEAVNHAQ